MRKLGFTQSQVDTLLAEHREDYVTVMFKLLNQWKNKNSEKNRQVKLNDSVLRSLSINCSAGNSKLSLQSKIPKVTSVNLNVQFHFRN